MWSPADRPGSASAAIAFFVAMACLPAAAAAHGATVSASFAPAIAVEARYDTGEPMAGAQVTVFAPGEPATPWLRGVADDAGRFVFLPDGRAGRWTVQARHAGHGAIVHLAPAASAHEPVAAATGPRDTRSEVGATPLQSAVMAIAVIWGLVGTALYFRRKGG